MNRGSQAASEDQTLSIPIEVKNIHYVLVSLHSPALKLKHTEARIPNGITVNVKVTLHDNLGQEFSHSLQETTALTYKLSHREQIGVSFGNNFTVSVSLPRETSTMLAIALKDSNSVKHNEDFVKFAVSKSKSKFPTKAIFSVGDVICFESPLAAVSNWHSSDEAIIRVDRHAGVGRVISTRSQFGEPVTVTNGDAATGHIKYDLEIREADNVEFYKSNDIFNGKSYKGHLVIRNHLQLDKLTNLVSDDATPCTFGANHRPFSGRPELVALLGAAAAVFGEVLRVQPQALEPAQQRVRPSARVPESVGNVRQGGRRVRVRNRTADADRRFDCADQKRGAEPGAHREPVERRGGRQQPANGARDKRFAAIDFGRAARPANHHRHRPRQSAPKNRGNVRILRSATRNSIQTFTHQITVSDASALEITPTTKAHGSLQYKIRVRKHLPVDETIFVNVHSPLTQQTIQIPIQSTSAEPKCVNQPFQSVPAIVVNLISNFGLIISALIVLSATIWGEFGPFLVCVSVTFGPRSLFTQIIPGASRLFLGERLWKSHSAFAIF